MNANSPMFPVSDNATAPGASRLQWLAGIAMQSLILRMESIPDSVAEREEIALWSYRMAQAMEKTEKMLGIQSELEATEEVG